MMMKYIGDTVSKKDRKKTLLWGCAALAALLAAAALAAWVASGAFGLYGRGLLASLPQPPEDAPLVAVETEGNGFPLRALGLFAESAAIPTGGTPLGELLPVFAGARRSALILTERETGLALYGVVQLSRGEERALAGGELPEAWSSALAGPEMTRTGPGTFEIAAGNLPAPLYLELDGRLASIAETPGDLEGIRRVRAGEGAGMERKWGIERRWEGHMLLSDGGVLAAMANDGAEASPLGIEVAWRADDGAGQNGRSDEVKWKILGLERQVGRRLLRALKPRDWSKETPLVPDRLLFSAGVNVPNPGRNMANLPEWLRFFAGQLTRMGLKDSEAAAMMTGPMTLSVGGRTQILWFELPGLVLDVPGRGKLAYKTLDGFWSQLFMGAEPAPVEGYTHGGVTELPFSVVAAANDEKMIVALADPAMPLNEEIGALIAREKKAIGWFFVDLPMIGASLEEMSSVNALLSADDDTPLPDGDSTGRLREALGKMGRLFVVWESPEAGRAIWYE